MPGIVGFVGRKDTTIANEALLRQMVDALEPEDVFRKEHYVHEAIGLGRATLDLGDTIQQPVWNNDHTVCLLMEGELFDKQALHHKFALAGSPTDDARFLMTLYEEAGINAIAELNGSFVLALWDSRKQELILANDRLGLHPLYYTQTENGFYFASGLRALLAEATTSRCVDHLAIAQFMTFDHLLHDRTLLQHVKLLPQATIAVAKDNNLSFSRYWEPIHPHHYELRSEQDWTEQMMALLRQAVARQAPGDLSAGMLLSGGMDSRVLLAIMSELIDLSAFPTFTWGIPGCDDARAAREVARHLGAQNHFFELKPDWLLQLAQDCVRTTDGMGNVINLHARATLDEEARLAKTIYKGFLGDAMMGYAQMHQHWADYDDSTMVKAHMEVHRQQGVITFGPESHEELFTPSFRNTIGSGVLDEYTLGMKNSRATLLADQRIFFDYTQRIPRHTLNGVQVTRSRAVVRLPFADNDLIDLMLRVPPGIRYERRIMRNAFIQSYPALARIPIPDTGVPMLDSARDIQIRIQRWVRWHLGKLGLSRQDYLNLKPYKDYNTWFRTTLRSWVEDTLLSKRALERGYFQADFVRNIVQEHMNGSDHTVRLGALLTLELWHRQFLEHTP